MELTDLSVDKVTRETFEILGIKDIAELTQHSESDLLAVKGFGEKRLFKLKRQLLDKQLSDTSIEKKNVGDDYEITEILIFFPVKDEYGNANALGVYKAMLKGVEYVGHIYAERNADDEGHQGFVIKRNIVGSNVLTSDEEDVLFGSYDNACNFMSDLYSTVLSSI